MRQNLQTRLGKKLSITPQMQQAIRFLQLSSLELQAEIQHALQSNPLLEISTSPLNSHQDPSSDKLTLESSFDELDRPHSSFEYDGEYDGTQANSSYPLSQNHNFGQDNNPFDYLAEEEDLRHYLYRQVNMLPISAEDQLIAKVIIDGIDEEGYLQLSNSEIQLSLANQPGYLNNTLNDNAINVVVHIIQHLEPIGVGARNLCQCLSLQLLQLPPTAHRQLALTLLRDFSKELENKNYAAIAKKLNISSAMALKAVQVIQTLNPKPGHQFKCQTAPFIVPDVFVSKHHQQWHVMLNHQAICPLRLNHYYLELIKKSNDNDQHGAQQVQNRRFLQDHLQPAKWFLKNIHHRHQTLLQIAKLIVIEQQAFFEHGPSGLKPMNRGHIATLAKVHESTVSRITTNKYIHTPHGIFELRYFFSSPVPTINGDQQSATTIRTMIKQFIEEEDDTRPLSDQQLMQLLGQKDIKIARRTVAKYREQLSLPSARQRRVRI